jgi:hypothetical protein
MMALLVWLGLFRIWNYSAVQDMAHKNLDGLAAEMGASRTNSEFLRTWITQSFLNFIT